MPDDHNYVEQLQEQMLTLREDNDRLTTEHETLSSENENLRAENERLRNLNQTYFNRLIAQDESAHGNGGADPDDEPEIPTCEEFAKTLKI